MPKKTRTPGWLPGVRRKLKLKWMGQDNPKVPYRQLPDSVYIAAGAIEVLLAQRAAGLPPTPGSVARIVRLVRRITYTFLLLHALREARRNILSLTQFDRNFLAALAVRA